MSPRSGTVWQDRGGQVAAWCEYGQLYTTVVQGSFWIAPYTHWNMTWQHQGPLWHTWIKIGANGPLHLGEAEAISLQKHSTAGIFWVESYMELSSNSKGFWLHCTQFKQTVSGGCGVCLGLDQTTPVWLTGRTSIQGWTPVVQFIPIQCLYEDNNWLILSLSSSFNELHAGCWFE